MRCPLCKLAYKLSRVNIKSNDKRVCQNVREAQKEPQSLQLQLQLKAGGRGGPAPGHDVVKNPMYLPFPLSPTSQAIISIANVQLIGNGTHLSTGLVVSAQFSMNGALHWHRHANAPASAPFPAESIEDLSSAEVRTPKFKLAAPARRLYGPYTRLSRLSGCIRNSFRMMGNQLIRH